MAGGSRKTTLLRGVVLGVLALAIAFINTVVWLAQGTGSSRFERINMALAAVQLILGALGGIFVVRDVPYVKGTASQVGAVAVSVVFWVFALGALFAFAILSIGRGAGVGARFN